MLVVETIARIRREHFIKGKTIKEIARDLRVSRNTVRKVLRSGETSFEYDREVQPRPKLGRWTADLNDLLTGNASKSAREQLTLIRIFEELRERGYDGGYDAVRRYARRWAKERGQATAVAYVPLSFAPGEAYQFDWSYEVVLLSGVTVTVKVAHVRLCHSRMIFVRAYPRESQEMVFDAHDRAFALFKGNCRRGIYDNMKTAVETVFVRRPRSRKPEVPGRLGTTRWPTASPAQTRHGAGSRLPRPAPHRHGRPRWLRLAGDDLSEPLGDRTRHYRHGLERPPVLCPACCRCRRKAQG
jgi:transposase